MPHLVTDYFRGIQAIVLFADYDGVEPTERYYIVGMAIDGCSIDIVFPQDAFVYREIQHDQLI